MAPASCHRLTRRLAGRADGVDPIDLLAAVAKLCVPPPGTGDTARANRMVALLMDGLRYGANRV